MTTRHEAVLGLTSLRHHPLSVTMTASSSTAGSRASSTASPTASQQNDDAAPSAKRRRSHAARSCLACRTRKARCQLANTDVPSSKTPLSREDACSRCVTKDIACVVWDGDRKGPRYTDRARKVRRTSDPLRSATAALAPERERGGEDLLSPFYPFDPTFEPEQEGGGARSATAAVPERASRAFARCAPPGDETRNGRMMQIIRRPMLLLHTLLARQDAFRVGVPAVGENGDHDTRKATAWLRSVAERLSSREHQRCLRTSDWCLLMQHAHLPRLQECIEAYAQSNALPSVSSSLLLCLMLYLCRAWHALSDAGDHDMATSLRHRLPHLIRNYGRQVIVRASRRVETAQALELLAVYMPHLLDGDDGAASEDRRLLDDDDATAGASIMAVAVRIGNALAVGASVEDAEFNRKRVLWASLSCWQIALVLHEQACNSLPDRAGLRQHETLAAWWTADEEAPMMDAVRKAGLAALKFRCETMLLTADYAIEGDYWATAPVPDDQLRTGQTEMMSLYQDALAHTMDGGRIQVDTMLALNDGKDGDDDAKLFTPVVRITWLWLEQEAHGLHQLLLTKIIGSLHDQRHRSHLAAHPTRPPVGQLWDDPEWMAPVSELGQRRMQDISDSLARACRFGTLLTGHERLTSGACAVVLPTFYLSAYLLSAAKSLLDAQTVLLLAWRHTHRDTDAHSVILHRLADAMAGERGYAPLDLPTTELGVARCAASIMRIVADTMITWQERQSLVLARHRLQQKARKEQARAQQHQRLQERGMDNGAPNDSNQTTPSSMLTTPNEPHRASGPPLFHGTMCDTGDGNGLSLLDSLFDGIMEMPEWGGLLDSLEQQQNQNQQYSQHTLQPHTLPVTDDRMLPVVPMYS